jgi:hypothetical protein
MTDLLKRLRHPFDRNEFGREIDRAEAADEIERLTARLAEQDVQLKSYDVLRRAVNESTNECGPDCDDHGHGDGCPALSPSCWLEDQQRTIDGLKARLAEAGEMLVEAWTLMVNGKVADDFGDRLQAWIDTRQTTEKCVSTRATDSAGEAKQCVYEFAGWLAENGEDLHELPNAVVVNIVDRFFRERAAGSAPAFNCKRCDGTGIYTERDPSGRLIERECECVTSSVTGEPDA